MHDNLWSTLKHELYQFISNERDRRWRTQAVSNLIIVSQQQSNEANESPVDHLTPHAKPTLEIKAFINSKE